MTVFTLYKTGDLVGQIKPHSSAIVPPNHLLCGGQLVAQATYPALFTTIGHVYNNNVDPGGGQFRLPDLRGRTPVGKDDMGGNVAGRMMGSDSKSIVGTTLGATGGREMHTLITGELTSHDHSSAGSHGHGNPSIIGDHKHLEANGQDNSGVFGSVKYYWNLPGGEPPWGRRVVTYAAESWAITGLGTPSSQSCSQNYVSPASTVQGIPTLGSDGTHTHTTVGTDSPHNNVQPGIILNYIIRF
jgi:microcystin-dependent protein